jgi:hypothetical protein
MIYMRILKIRSKRPNCGKTETAKNDNVINTNRTMISVNTKNMMKGLVGLYM